MPSYTTTLSTLRWGDDKPQPSFTNQRYSLSNRVADGFQDDRLFSGRNARCGCDKLHQIFPRVHRLLAKKSDSRWIVLIARVDACREEVTGRGEAYGVVL